MDLLLACHERIRRFTALGVQLAAVAAPRPEELAEAARGVLRYFTVALPLHVQDEELSLLPRLEKDPSLARMTQEHEAIEHLLDGLVPRWQALADDPGRHVALATELHRDAVLLRAAFDGHLTLEERTIFPAVATLEPRLQAEIRAEMRGRREG